MSSWSRWVLVSILCIVCMGLVSCSFDKLSIDKGTLSYPSRLTPPKAVNGVPIVLPESSL